MPAPQDDVIERTLPPHKSWRELPPTPPLGVPLPPPEATQTFAVPDQSREPLLRRPSAAAACLPPSSVQSSALLPSPVCSRS